MDEEAIMNAPQAPRAQPPESAGRTATPQEQRMFDVMAKQALQMLTSEAGARALHKLAVSQGPDRAIADTVSRVLNGVGQAADGAGIQISPDVRSAAARTAAQVLGGLLTQAGMGDDAAGLSAAAVRIMEGGEAAEVPDGPAL